MSAREQTRVVGRPYAKVDAAAKVHGRRPVSPTTSCCPRMLHCKLLRSQARARAHRVDRHFEALERVPGSSRCATGADLPIPFGILPVSQDEHALCLDRVRFVGDPVAAVAAVDEDAAFEALDLIDVEYEPLPAIARSTEDALATRSRRIHDYGDAATSTSWSRCEFGDVDEGFARGRPCLRGHSSSTRAARTSRSSSTPRSPTVDADGKLTLWSCTQTPHYVHRALAKVLDMPPAQIRVDRNTQRRRLRRQERSLQPRDRRRARLPRDRAAREDLPDARGSLLLPSRPPSRR